MPDNNSNEFANAVQVNETVVQPQEKKSFCKYCGSVIKSGVAFCPSCGQPQTSMPQQVSRPVFQQPNQFYGQTIQQPPHATMAASPQTNQTTVIVQGGRSNGMGTAGFVIAILAFFVCWVPIVDIIVWFLGALFSFIGLFKAPRGLAIAGFVISFIGIIILVTFFGALIGLSRF